MVSSILPLVNSDIAIVEPRATFAVIMVSVETIGLSSNYAFNLRLLRISAIGVFASRVFSLEVLYFL